MKVKTSQSFFPTKVRPSTPGSHLSTRSHIYKLAKKDDSQSRSTSKSSSVQNIFRTEILEKQDFGPTIQKPVGGFQAFNREQNRKKIGLVDKNGSQLRDNLSQLKDNSSLLRENQSAIQNKKQNEGSKAEKKRQLAEQGLIAHQNSKTMGEIFKQHQEYQNKSKATISWKTTKRPQTCVTRSEKDEKICNWADEQSQQYQTKMAFVNERYYKKPLVERYGQRYFEYFLRDRYQEELPPPTFIHQIHSKSGLNLKKDRFISKLQKMNSVERSYEKMSLKGRGLGVGP